MKIFILCFFILFMNCISQQKNAIQHNSLVQFNIEIPDTIAKNQQGIPIILKIKNLTSEPITIANPAYWVNAYPSIKKDGNDVQVIKVKANLQLLNDMITIKEKDTFETVFDFSLDKIMGLGSCEEGNYEVSFELKGLVHARINICSIFILNSH